MICFCWFCNNHVVITIMTKTREENIVKFCIQLGSDEVKEIIISYLEAALGKGKVHLLGVEHCSQAQIVISDSNCIALKALAHKKRAWLYTGGTAVVSQKLKNSRNFFTLTGHSRTELEKLVNQINC